MARPELAALVLTYKPIYEYGLISDMHGSALVGSDGSIDWCCIPRFDSAALFSSILDSNKGGFFKLAPTNITETSRRYLPNTNILETSFTTRTGAGVLLDFMPVHRHIAMPREPMEETDFQRVVRILHCTRGRLDFEMECCPRFDYGTVVPHASLSSPNTGMAHGGADAVSVYCSASLSVVNDGFRARGAIFEREKLYATVSNQLSFSHWSEPLTPAELEQELADTTAFWETWSSQITFQGEYREAVLRSALTLKALTYAPSGGLVAAPTTSLPEAIGGGRNWDYRYTWIRDTTFALYALSIIGCTGETRAFKDWLEWSTSGRARDLQVVYGLGGERRLTEIEIPELEGYEKSRPVRIGNGAYDQFQLDIYGEIMDSAHIFRKFGGDVDAEYWEYLRRVVNFVMDHWKEPDEGIWETRGGRQHFIFSKVMCWVAMDRAVRAASDLGLPGDVEVWKKVREEIRADVMEKGFSVGRQAFVQSYGSTNLDAANLMLPLVGFIPATDPKMRSTIRAIQADLTSPQGFVYRYTDFDDGLDGTEGSFTICTFWLADNLIQLGEADEARKLFDAAMGCANDLGLLSEEFDTATGAMLGNFPQAFSHLAMINTAVQLQEAADGAAHIPDRT
ncbi:MAG: glycoside hydrolase family 15 protein [Dehalococcoidia bacterium]|nr:glycoside hydrolase family 15 protein [Dehalococcoidia bacterium]